MICVRGGQRFDISRESLTVGVVRSGWLGRGGQVGVVKSLHAVAACNRLQQPVTAYSSLQRAAAACSRL